MSASQVLDQNEIERRGTRRYAKRMHAHLRERGRSGHIVEVIDVSAEGCTVDTSGMAGNFNAPIWLRMGDVSSLQAKLIWSNGQRGGLLFEQPLHDAVLTRLVGANDHAKPTRRVEEPAAPPSSDIVASTAKQSRSEQIKQGYVDQSILSRKNPIGHKPLETLVERKFERNTDHRFEARYPSEITSGPTYVSMKDSTAQVRDISASGLGLSSPADRGIGEAVEVTFMNCDAIPGRVIWRKGNRFGVELSENAIQIEEEDR